MLGGGVDVPSWEHSPLSYHGERGTALQGREILERRASQHLSAPRDPPLVTDLSECVRACVCVCVCVCVSRGETVPVLFKKDNQEETPTINVM